jgi:hypothetical protein
MSYDPEDVGGDPACWLHLFEDDFAGEGETDEGEAAAAPEHGAGEPG